MSNSIVFKNPKSREEFLEVFENICGIAEKAFQLFEEGAKTQDIKEKEDIKRHLSYLIGITKTIRGLRGDSVLFQNDDIRPFFVEKDGAQYDQDSLYKAEAYFCDKLNSALEILKQADQKTYESFLEMWRC